VKVRDVLPAGTTFVSATDTTGGAGSFVCSHAGGIVDCVGGTLDGSLGLAGVPTLRTIQIIVTAPQQTGVTLTNQAFIDPFSEIAEGSEINNFASDTTLVQSQINLKTTKLGPQESAPQGSIQNYEIKVKNEGTMPAFGVKVVDPMPVGMIILTVDPGTNTNFACEVFENPVNFIECIGDLDADEEVSIKIRTFITADSGGSTTKPAPTRTMSLSSTTRLATPTTVPRCSSSRRHRRLTSSSRRPLSSTRPRSGPTRSITSWWRTSEAPRRTASRSPRSFRSGSRSCRPWTRARRSPAWKPAGS
jgi:uncharacterized repeat protein (TIGR01451 family)